MINENGERYSDSFLDDDPDLYNEIFSDRANKNSSINKANQNQLIHISNKDIIKNENKKDINVDSAKDKNNKNIKYVAEIGSFNTENNKNIFSSNNSEREDDSEHLMQEQLVIIKNELKETRIQRDEYKKKFEESITYGDRQSQLIMTLQTAFENLLMEITINTKVKDYAVVILNILGINEEEQKRIFEKKKKVGFLSGIFKK